MKERLILSLKGAYYRAVSVLSLMAGRRGSESLATILSFSRYFGNRSFNRIYLGHLSRIFPDMSPEQLRGILRGYWRVHQRSILGLFNSRNLNEGNIEGLVRWEGRELLDDAVEKGRGVILLVPHFGDERTLHILLAISGYRMHVISSRYHDAPEFVRRTRLSASRKWHHVAFPDEPPKWLFDSLRNGEVVQISPTAWGGPRGHWVKSLGVPVLASSTPMRVAAATGCSLLIAYNRVLPGLNYEIAFRSFEPDSLDIRGTSLLFGEYEKLAVQHPMQYNWMNIVIRHRETNTIHRLGYIPEEESVLEREAIPSDWDPSNVKDLQSVSSIT